MATTAPKDDALQRWDGLAVAIKAWGRELGF